MITFLKNVISRVENSKKPLVYFILTFFFATTLRNFLEVFSTRLEIPLEYFVHYYLSYISLALAIILLFYLVTREKIDKLAKVILPSFLVLVLVPIIDLIFLIFSGQVYRITYMISGGYNLLLRFFTFFGSFSGFGITPGMRIEIALILIISFFYFKIKTKSVLKSLLSSFLLYTLIFIYCAMPFVVKSLLAISNIFTELSNRLMINFYLLLIFVLLLVIFWLRNRSYLVNLIKDIRPFRLLHFELMFIFGIVLTKVLWKTDLIFLLKRENIFHFIFILISIMLAWLFSVIFNNLEDVDIDKITNRLRPSVINSIPSKAYKLIGLIALFLAVIFSLAVNFWIFFLILCFVGNYFFYSMPPLRLKRIPVFSKLMIAFSSLLLVILGFIFAGGNLLEFPPMFTLSFLIFLTLVINFIDIKDYRGDKKAGIKTLPVILGLKKSKLLIGSFFLIPAVIIPIFWQKFFLLIPALIFAGGEFILINKKNYQEKWVFSLHLTGLIILLVYLMVH